MDPRSCHGFVDKHRAGAIFCGYGRQNRYSVRPGDGSAVCRMRLAHPPHPEDRADKSLNTFCTNSYLNLQTFPHADNFSLHENGNPIYC